MDMQIDKAKLEMFLKERNVSNKCPLCGMNELNAFVDFVAGVQAAPFNSLPGRHMPLVTLVCNNCGCTTFISALQNNLLVSTDGGAHNGQ
ncbi:MAG: hypothetical protein FWB80_13090 [Defluviitaleaceae bacterium]|nr:hypothetical protein [Defluviitaleaceae bacterium]